MVSKVRTKIELYIKIIIGTKVDISGPRLLRIVGQSAIQMP